MTPKAEVVHESLDGLAIQPGVAAATLVTRDGFLVYDAKNRLRSPAGTSAMAASCFGAAEVALETLGVGRIQRIVVQAERHMLVALDAGADHVLLVLVDDPQRLEDILKAGETVCQRVRHLIAEASR